MNTPLPAVKLPRMERRHFEVFAEAMRQAREVAMTAKPGGDTTTAAGLRLLQHETDCQAIARVLATVNPAFDKARFLAACGVL